MKKKTGEQMAVTWALYLAISPNAIITSCSQKRARLYINVLFRTCTAVCICAVERTYTRICTVKAYTGIAMCVYSLIHRWICKKLRSLSKHLRRSAAHLLCTRLSWCHWLKRDKLDTSGVYYIVCMGHSSRNKQAPFFNFEIYNNFN